MSGLFSKFLFLLCITFSTISTTVAAQDGASGKAVLITGASSGIGRMAAEQLAADGYFVYAGARRASDIAALNKIDNIMPMVIEAEGRIVNVSSIAGVLSGGLHGYGMYMMSKHAVEAYSDQLSFEMAPLGVKVSAIEPGSFRSEIGMSRCKRMIRQSENREYRYFADEMQQYLDQCEAALADPQANEGPLPGPVADAIQHALFDEQPKEHYLVVPEQFQAMITISKAFEELLFLNHDHEYSYTREQLIALMDEQQSFLDSGSGPGLVPENRD